MNKMISGLATTVLLSCAATTLYAQPSVITIVQQSLPSLVSVESEITGAYQSPHASAAIDKKTGRLLVLRNVKAAQYTRSGSGVIISPKGLIVTNAHIVVNARHVRVTLHNKKIFNAKIVWYVPQKDLAFLLINTGFPLKTISFADSDRTHLGQEVVTVGSSPFLQETISGGKIIGIGSSASKKRLGNTKTQMLQINVNLYKGDSGGPLLDKKGRLLGLMAAGQIKRDRSSFAIPSNEIKKQYMIYTENRE